MPPHLDSRLPFALPRRACAYIRRESSPREVVQCAHSVPSSSRCSCSPSRPRRPAPPNGSGWATRSPPGPLIPNQSLVAARLPALEQELRPAGRRERGAHADRRLLQRRADHAHDAPRRARRRDQPAAAQRAHRGHRRSCRCRSAATTSASPRSSRTASPTTRSGGRARTATTRAATTRSRPASTPPRRRWPRSSQGIRAKSPSARILLVNYAAILPETGSGCWPQVPLAYADVPYLRTKQKQLNAMLAAAGARANGARLRRRLHGEHRPRRVQVLRARAGSSRWCPATPPRRSIPTPAAWRASLRWSRRRRG